MFRSSLVPPVVLALALAGCNTAPEGGSIAVLPEAPTTEDHLTLEIVQPAVDPNGSDTVGYDIAWYRDGTLVPELTTLREVNSSLTAKGQVWSVEVTPTDGKDPGAVLKAAATVVNAAAKVTSVTLSPTSPAEGDTVLATVEGKDADGDAIEYAYAWFVGGNVVTETSAEISSDYFDKGDAIYVEVTPSDGDDTGATVASSPVTAVNTPPQATSAVIAPADGATESSTLSCEGRGWTDIDGDTEAYDFSWAVNGSAAGTDETLTGDAFSRGDKVTCTATPNDGDSTGAPQTSGEVIIGNSPPTLATVTLSTSSPVHGDTITAALGTATDIDGDEVTFTYAWFVGEIEVSEAESLTSEYWSKGDNIYLRVTPRDDADAGDSVKSDTAVAANTAPVISSIALSGPITAESSSITATPTASDVDGDPLTYSATWYVDGKAMTTTSTTYSATFKKGSDIYVDVKADDGDDSVTLRSPTISVQNTPPGSPTISMKNSSPAETADILCVVDKAAVDIDGDPLTYRFKWKKGGADWTGSVSTTTLTGDTIASSNTSGGQVWACLVEAHDGTEFGVAATTTATVKSPWDGKVTFSNCGTTGYIGPTQSTCDTAYASTNLKGLVTVSSGTQAFTIPADGSYRVEVWGAQGGKCGGRGCGGKGARMRGDFSLKKGDVLQIIVGQEGSYKGFGSGGGGGSFVVKKSGSTQLVIAGGGGGAGHTGTVGYNGTTASCGLAGGYSSAGAGGCTGKGGVASSSYGGTYNNSGGGGGFSTDGVGDGTKTNPGKAFLSGGAGGKDSGGFGGGGGGEVHAWDCGNGNGGGSGGGGYSGGGGGGGSCNGPGGGGGSYNGGSSQSNSTGVKSGQGSITIDRL
ncbi:MAG: hypothetical protein ACI9MC_001675 [Kiritimatiellia bacterium]|jgi:hypothetical protein